MRKVINIVSFVSNLIVLLIEIFALVSISVSFSKANIVETSDWYQISIHGFVGAISLMFIIILIGFVVFTIISLIKHNRKSSKGLNIISGALFFNISLPFVFAGGDLPFYFALVFAYSLCNLVLQIVRCIVLKNDNVVKLYLYDVTNMDDDISEVPLVTSSDMSEARKYKQINDQKLHIASSYLKRKYIKEYSISDSGKPISKNCFFNVSHSGSLVIMGVSKLNDIGVDTEVIEKKDLNDLIDYVCSKEEKDSIKTTEDFYKVWVSKESLVKCVGLGIKKDMKDVLALPLDGAKEYEGINYYSHLIEYNDYFISITLKGKEDFKIEIEKER